MQPTAPRRSPAARPQRDILPLSVAETTELPLEALTPTERDSFFGSFFADTVFDAALALDNIADPSLIEHMARALDGSGPAVLLIGMSVEFDATARPAQSE